MIAKIKNYFESRKIYKSVLQANDYYTIKPFLLGCQVEYRRFGNYLFVKNTAPNMDLLTQRSFNDFKQAITSKVNWEFNDQILDIGECIMYNDKYNIMISMINEKSWEKLNTAINIAEKIDVTQETKRDIVINAYELLA